AGSAVAALCTIHTPRATQLLVQYLETPPSAIALDNLAGLTADHPDAGIREIVARLLLSDQSDPGEGTTRFAAIAMTRTAERRRTREHMKQRLKRGNYLDIADLEVVATSGSMSDVEWAIRELARRATDGDPSGSLRVVRPFEGA